MAFGGFRGFGEEDSPIYPSMTGGEAPRQRIPLTQRLAPQRRAGPTRGQTAANYANMLGSLASAYMGSRVPSAQKVNPNFDYGSIGTRVNAPTWGGF